MPYESVGGAFSNAIDESIAQQAAAKRQALMDQLAIRREQDVHEQGQAALAEKKAESLARIEEKERGDTEKDVNNMVIGDIPDPDLVARAKKYHVPLRTITPPSAGTALPAAAPMPTPPGGGPATPPPTGAPALPTAQPMPMRFGGTQAQVIDEQKKTQIQGLIDSLPKDSPERKRLEEERITGRTVPAGAYKDTTSEMVPTYVRDANGQLKPSGMVPKDAKIEPERAPKAEPTGHYTVQALLDAGGKPTGKFMRVNNLTGEISDAPSTASSTTLTKPPPGAGPLATQKEAATKATRILDYMDKDIDAANAKGLIGPYQGRLSDLELDLGNADPAIATLASRMTMAKMLVDASMGGTRAAASPLLLKRWDNLLASKVTAENLHAVSKVMRELASGEEPTSTGPKRLHYNLKTGQVE